MTIPHPPPVCDEWALDAYPLWTHLILKPAFVPIGAIWGFEVMMPAEG